MRSILSPFPIAVLHIFIIVGCTKSVAIETPADLRNEVAISEKNGKSLYDAYIANPKIKNIELLNSAKDLIKNFCELDYQKLIVKEEGEEVVYFIGQPPKKNHLVLGRHYKVKENFVIPSTKTCSIMAPPSLEPGSEVAAVFTTHLLSQVPSEFHVFLSLWTQQEIYVGTSIGIWKVFGDQIMFFKER